LVSVFLPRAAMPAERTPSSRAGRIEAWSTRAVVLVVDDDDAVRAITSDMLSGLGYTVRAASGGTEALAQLDNGDTIDLLLTDVVMPGMSGPELARRVRVSRPHLPIVFISGYANPEGIAGEPLERLVRKPFSASGLRDQIEEAINEARASVT
jgi:CheY-like chemotaxis protein